MHAKTIDDVISILEDIIARSKHEADASGYFAALYLLVTRQVKKGVEEGFFEDGPRMEKLDVVFANRYLEAYYQYHKQQEPTASWQITFLNAQRYWPIVLQHLLLGMNAHINLDLGIAAAEISQNKPIEHLKNDFMKINTILAGLVDEVQNDLAKIWPTLKVILKWTGKADDFLVDFSMKTARDGAWDFAQLLSQTPADKINETIQTRDKKIAEVANIITQPGIIVKWILRIIRLGERGSVASRITLLE